MLEAEETALTGIKVSRASDDPSRWPEIDQLTVAIEDQKTWSENITRSEIVLHTADQGLGYAVTFLSRARELAVQLTNEIYSATERTAGAAEVDLLRTQILGVANTEVAGRHIFAGNAYDAEAFDPAGTYLGTNDQPETKVGKDTYLATGYDGAAVFQGTVDIFDVLNTLSAAMTADDPIAIRNTLDDLDTGLQQLIGTRSEVGFSQLAAQDTSDIITSMEQLFQAKRDELVSEDPANSYSKMMELRTSYEAAMQVTSSTMKTSLFDYIR